MEKARQLSGAPGWLSVNLAAFGFSLVHALGDFGLLLARSSSASASTTVSTSSSPFAVQQALLALLIGLLYGWWGWVFARAVQGARSGFVGLMAFSIGWVLIGNGLTIVYCLPPCGPVPFVADIIHISNLILGPLSAVLSYRAMRHISTPVNRFALTSNIVIMLALLVALFGVEASLVNV